MNSITNLQNMRDIRNYRYQHISVNQCQLISIATEIAFMTKLFLINKQIVVKLTIRVTKLLYENSRHTMPKQLLARES